MKIDPKTFHPVEYKVLIKSDEETDPTLKSAKAAGLHIVETTTERDKVDAVWGEIISMGGKSCEDFGDPKPRAGDRIYFARYAGQMLEGLDGCEYRIINDKDIVAIEVKEAVND